MVTKKLADLPVHRDGGVVRDSLHLAALGIAGAFLSFPLRVLREQ